MFASCSATQILILDQLTEAFAHHLGVDRHRTRRQIRRLEAQLLEQALHHGM
jgi:hypothetical protein